jgi:hypothetical protein
MPRSSPAALIEDIGLKWIGDNISEFYARRSAAGFTKLATLAGAAYGRAAHSPATRHFRSILPSFSQKVQRYTEALPTRSKLRQSRQKPTERPS